MRSHLRGSDKPGGVGLCIQRRCNPNPNGASGALHGRGAPPGEACWTSLISFARQAGQGNAEPGDAPEVVKKEQQGESPTWGIWHFPFGGVLPIS
eukprot:scaffold1505_cov256-Pinguiococcus_pyrenoidosus.AAC.18